MWSHLMGVNPEIFLEGSCLPRILSTDDLRIIEAKSSKAWVLNISLVSENCASWWRPRLFYFMREEQPVGADTFFSIREPLNPNRDEFEANTAEWRNICWHLLTFFVSNNWDGSKLGHTTQSATAVSIVLAIKSHSCSRRSNISKSPVISASSWNSTNAQCIAQHTGNSETTRPCYLLKLLACYVLEPISKKLLSAPPAFFTLDEFYIKYW